MTLGRELDIQTHLERVSRSFAFCIARLDEPLRHQVGLSYLLCRILDTNEDAKWSDIYRQKLSFDAFLQMLVSFEGATRWSEALLADATGVSLNEKLLIRDTDLVIAELKSLPESVRQVIVPPVISMAQGMREFALTRSRNDGRLKLQSNEEVNRYCFFVAGVVGELLDGLLRIEAAKSGVPISTRLSDGFHFGLFLQKVNLLKDRESDVLEGRDLVPFVPDVFQTCLQDAEHAFSYVKAIPGVFCSYRLFCAWSLFLGLASLRHIITGSKIGRVETLGLLANVEFKIENLVSLEILFRQCVEATEQAAGDMPKRNCRALKFVANSESEKGLEQERLARYRQHYVGTARDEDLSNLGGDFECVSYVSIR